MRRRRSNSVLPMSFPQRPTSNELAGELAAARRAHLQALSYMSLDELETHADELERVAKEDGQRPAGSGRTFYQDALTHIAEGPRQQAAQFRAQHPDGYDGPIFLDDWVGVVAPEGGGLDFFEPLEGPEHR